MDDKTLLIIIILVLLISLQSNQCRISNANTRQNPSSNFAINQPTNDDKNDEYISTRDSTFAKMLKKSKNKSNPDKKTNLLQTLEDIKNETKSNFENSDERTQLVNNSNDLILYKDFQYKDTPIHVPINNKVLIGKQDIYDTVMYYNSIEFPKGNYLIITSESGTENKNYFYIIHKNIPNLEDFLTLQNIISFDNKYKMWKFYITALDKNTFNKKESENKLNYVSKKNNCIDQNKLLGLNMSDINKKCELNL
jgi:hypothetical protein